MIIFSSKLTRFNHLLSYKRKNTSVILISLSNRLKPFIQTANTIKTTAITKIITVPINRPITAEVKRVNAMCVKRRTAAYEDTHKKNVSALRKYTEHNLT
jgi:hypothetical protein